MDNNNKKRIIIGLAIFWGVYSIVIMNFGDCSYWIEEYNDGWYLMSVVVEDDISYSEQLDGPFNEELAIKRIEECKQDAAEFKNCFGTIYNLIPNTNRNVYGEKENIFVAILGHLMRLSFLILPLLYLSKHYEKVEG